MILFQIDKIVLTRDIDNLTITVTEEQDTSSIESKTIEGDHRVSKTTTTRIKYKIKGLVKSQHLANYIKTITAKDKGRGDIKCFFIDKYVDFNSVYQPVIKVNDESKSQSVYKIYFNYCHIDILANKNTKDQNDLDTEIEFDISLNSSSSFEITKSFNAYILDSSLYNDSVRYDTGLTYDSGVRYDTLLRQLQQNSKSLWQNRDNLDSFYKSVTCCACDNQKISLFFIDHIIKPFIPSNRFNYSGIINGDVSNFAFSFVTASFLQLIISNPANPLTIVKKQVQLGIFGARDTPPPNNVANASPFVIRNIDINSNSYTHNAIIQLSRMPFMLTNTGIPVYRPDFDVPLVNLFQELGQSINIKTENSSLIITCKSAFIRDNLKLLVIHPHTQKMYGHIGTVNPIWTFTTFSFSASSGLVDLENYMLNSDITVTTDTFETNSWFTLAPQYEYDIFSNRSVENITFSTDMQAQDIAFNTAIFLQIQTFVENKPI